MEAQKGGLAQQTPGLMTALIAGQISLLSVSLTQIQNTQIQEYTNTKERVLREMVLGGKVTSPLYEKISCWS